MGVARASGCDILYSSRKPPCLSSGVLGTSPTEYDKLFPDVAGHRRLSRFHNRDAVRNGCGDLWFVYNHSHKTMFSLEMPIFS